MPSERASSSSKGPVATDGTRARRQPDALTENGIRVVGAENPLKQLKSGGVSLPAASMAHLHRSVGNKAVSRLLDPGAASKKAVQRHWLEGEEKVQALHDTQQSGSSRSLFGNHVALDRGTRDRHEQGRRLWRNMNAPIRRDDGKGGGVAVADKAATEAAKGSIDSITFAQPEIPADGKTSTTATAAVKGGATVSKWSIVGNAFGSTVDASGIVTPGTDLKGAESAIIKVQATDEKGGATKVAELKLWDAKFFQAKIDYPKFLAGAYTLPNFTKGFNGKFDVTYDPASKLATADMKLKFVWPEEKVEAPSQKNLWGLITAVKHASYKSNFVAEVMKQWSGRYEFQNVREPKSIWGKLNPVAVKINLQMVEADQHFTIEVRDRATKAGESTAVGGGVLKLYQGDDVPAPQFNPSTGAGELTRLNRVTPTPILFGNNSTEVPAADRAKLETMGTYISRINNPKFDIQVVGHSSATGVSADNQPLSEKRAQAVVDILNATGATNHNIKGSGVGDTGAAKTADWRKVEIANSLPAGWTNLQDTTAHEFGHMIGLGDEYAAAGVPKSTHYDLVAKAFGKDYAEQVAKRGDADHASIMDGGNDVRIQHYVTFWSALAETTLKAADPDPKFGYDDWKFVGT